MQNLINIETKNINGELIQTVIARRLNFDHKVCYELYN